MSQNSQPLEESVTLDHYLSLGLSKRESLGQKKARKEEELRIGTRKYSTQMSIEGWLRPQPPQHSPM
jgi:hypothetical protein